MGIGGEYAAIHSAIDELIPARYRGRVDIAVNGTYWGGAILGSLGQLHLAQRRRPQPGLASRLPHRPGDRRRDLAVRRNLPESPRWQLMHGRVEGRGPVARSSARSRRTGVTLPKVDESKAIEVEPTDKIGHLALTRALFREYPSAVRSGRDPDDQPVVPLQRDLLHVRAVLQVLRGRRPGRAAYLLRVRGGNLIGPLVLGRFFDTIGRRQMISGTYLRPACCSRSAASCSTPGVLTASRRPSPWSVIFFIASAAASAAYLTVSEIFPLELRAQAIACSSPSRSAG